MKLFKVKVLGKTTNKDIRGINLYMIRVGVPDIITYKNFYGRIIKRQFRIFQMPGLEVGVFTRESGKKKLTNFRCDYNLSPTKAMWSLLTLVLRKRQVFKQVDKFANTVPHKSLFYINGSVEEQRASGIHWRDAEDIIKEIESPTPQKPNEMNLIEQAKALHFTDWGQIDNLIGKTNDPLVINELESIQLSKYHEEEAFAGLI